MSPKLLVLLCLLAALAQKTEITVDLLMRCGLWDTFEAEVSLYEDDDFSPDDLLVEGVMRMYNGKEEWIHFEGNQTTDAGSYNFEFYVYVKHWCTVNKTLNIEQQYLFWPIGKGRHCSTDDKECRYNTEFLFYRW